VQFDIDFVMKCWLIKYLYIYNCIGLPDKVSYISQMVHLHSPIGQTGSGVDRGVGG